MSKDGGTPWQVWAAVTILVALIGTFGKSALDGSSVRSAGINRSDTATAPGGPSTEALVQANRSATERFDWGEHLGVYSGKSINRLYNSKGDTRLELKAVEASGKMRAAIEWSHGLSGSGTLFGDASGRTAELSGTIISVETGIWECEVRLSFALDGSIHGFYRLYPRPGNPNGTQDGEFELE